MRTTLSCIDGSLAIYQCSVYIVVPHDSAAKTKLLTPLLNYEVFKVHGNVNTHM